MHSTKMLSQKYCLRQITKNLSRSSCPRKKAAAIERTFIMIKPDAIKRNIISKVFEKFEQKGYKLVAMKLVRPSIKLLDSHYNRITKKRFYHCVVDYMKEGPVIPMVWEGQDIINQGRSIIGDTNPLVADRGSIRGDFAIDLNRNVIHGADSVETAEKEIKLWFTEEEIVDWDNPLDSIINEYGEC